METHLKRKVHREAISNNLILNHSVGWGENSEYKGENIWFGNCLLWRERKVYGQISIQIFAEHNREVSQRHRPEMTGEREREDKESETEKERDKRN